MVSAALTLPVLILAMGPVVGLPLPGRLGHGRGKWLSSFSQHPWCLGRVAVFRPGFAEHSNIERRTCSP